MDPRPRFIADAMLGSLAKWLRIMGFDTLYYRVIDDNELVRTAKQEGRILITRDTGICRSKKAGKCLLIHTENTKEQLREVMKVIGIQPEMISSSQRCAICNGELISAERSSVSGDTPEHVFRHASAFLKCGECGKVYWEGSHKRMIDGVIAAIKKEMEAR